MALDIPVVCYIEAKIQASQILESALHHAGQQSLSNQNVNAKQSL